MMLVPLKSLIPGGAIDSRSAGGERDIESLANSIAHLGLILPLAVVQEGTRYRVIDGNRRLEALKIVNKGKKNAEVPVHLQAVDTDQSTARAMSLAANIERLPLHPMDQYEAFAAIAADGKALSEVAATFGVSERGVRQRMALGSLCEEARQSYRAGGLSADLAQAFTRISSEEQLKLLKTGEPSWKLRQQIDRMTQEGAIAASSGIARFVGRDNYIAAGGTFVPDLFADENNEMWADAALVGELANAAINDVREKSLKLGWQFFEVTDAWVGQEYVLEDAEGEPVGLTDEEKNEVARLRGRLDEIENASRHEEEDYSDDEHREISSIEYQLGQLEDDKRSWTEEQRARCGVVVDAHYAIHFGAKRREGVQPKEKVYPDAAGSEPAEKPGQSTAVMMELDAHLTNACRGALIDRPRTAVRLLALTFLSDYYLFDEKMQRLNAGVGIRCDMTGNILPRTDYKLSDIESMVKASGLLKAKNFEAKMKAMDKIADEGIDKIIAYFTAWSLQTRHRNSELVLYLDKAGALDIRQHFTPDLEQFFGRLTKDQLRMVAVDMGVNFDGLNWGTLKKNELAVAVAKAMPDKWIPEAIRPTPNTK